MVQTTALQHHTEHVQWDLLAVALLKLNNVLCAIHNQTVSEIKQKFPVQIHPYLILST